jgi:ribosomal protein S12 methylthiotransferase
MHTFYIDHHGCAKNQVDGEEISSRLVDAGFCASDSPENAEIVIVNTCGFIEDAKKESIAAIVDAKSRWPNKKIIAAGCLSQRYAQEFSSDLPEADGFLGNSDLSIIPDAVAKISTGERIVLCSPQRKNMPQSYYPRKTFYDFPGTAHLKIMEGCSNHCSYCAIPLIRGELRSRSIDDIVAEAQNLVRVGIYEVVLIGQDLGNFGKDSTGRCLLPELLSTLDRLEGNFRIRVLYIHPDHFPFEILPIIAKSKKIVPYFDLPFQHASPDVLSRMGRRGSYELYLNLITTIRSALPNAMIRSTFLVGFPGETEDDFQTLLKFQQNAKLDWLGVFAYSREENTPSYDMKPRVPKNIAYQRKSAIEAAQIPITTERLQRFIGMDADFVIEEQFENEALSIGRGWMQAPEVDGVTFINTKLEPGSIVHAQVSAVHGVDFNAILEYTPNS